MRKYATKQNATTVLLALVAILALSLIRPSMASATIHSVTPSVQMLNATFVDQDLPLDGSTLTLLSIPFTTDATTRIDVTSLIDGIWGGSPSCCGSFGPNTIETCNLLLDSTSIDSSTFSSNASGLAYPLSMTTVKNGIPSGSHTLSLACTGSNPNGSSGVPVLAHSGGTSVAIVSGA